MSERTQKLLRLAQALEILRERLLADAVDPTTAAALREQLSGTLAELSALRRLVGDSPATEATRRLYLAWRPWNFRPRAFRSPMSSPSPGQPPAARGASTRPRDG